VTVVQVFSDHGISGKNGREKRPGLHNLLQGVARRDFDSDSPARPGARPPRESWNKNAVTQNSRACASSSPSMPSILRKKSTGMIHCLPLY
jgi:hypothetical protein